MQKDEEVRSKQKLNKVNFKRYSKFFISIGSINLIDLALTYEALVDIDKNGKLKPSRWWRYKFVTKITDKLS